MLGALLAIHRSEVRLNGTVELIALVGEEVDCAGANHLMRTGSIEGVRRLSESKFRTSSRRHECSPCCQYGCCNVSTGTDG